MQSLVICLVSATFLLSIVSLSVWAQNPHDPHPTITAVHRLGHRKAARVANATHHARQSVRNWKHRKGHKVRAWLNKHESLSPTFCFLSPKPNKKRLLRL